MLVVCFLSMLLKSPANSQIPPEAAMEDAIERSTERQDSPFDYSDLEAGPDPITGKPVNINKATPEALQRIPFLTGAQRKELSNYLLNYGEVFSVFELASVPGFDSALLQRLLPYIFVGLPPRTPAMTPRNLFKFSHHDLLIRYEQVFPSSAGYIPAGDSTETQAKTTGYAGNPQRYYFRYRYTWFDRLSFGIAGEKDPGEQFFRGAQPMGMDYYAWHLSLMNLGILQNVTIGNFRAGFGQGLTFGSGFSPGGSPGFSVVPSGAGGARQSLGITEGNYLRGIMAAIRTGRIGITGFISYHSRDANVTGRDSITGTANLVSSFSESGYHRTTNELEDRNALKELITGIHVDITGNFFRIGATAVRTAYSASLENKEEAWSVNDFSGSTNLNTGIDFQVRFHSVYLFGEVCRSINGGLAAIAGMVITPDPGFSLTVIARNYQPAFQNLNSNAFGQNSRNTNEKGIFGSAQTNIGHGISFAGYLDLFSFPWLRYRVDAPTQGTEWGVAGFWSAARNLMLQLRYCQKGTYINEPGTDSRLNNLIKNRTGSYRFHSQFQINQGIHLGTRLEVRETKTGAGQTGFGYLVYQDIRIRPERSPLGGTLRYAVFDIPGYDQRIYVYEPEVLWGYSVPAYSGKGMRLCLVLNWEITRKIETWLRFGLYNYSDREVVGTGADQTTGNLRADLSCQILLKL
jgi:hypothetical protein